MMKAGTELPWWYDPSGKYYPKSVIRHNGMIVCTLPKGHTSDAAYIAHAANLYPELVEALREQKAYLDAITETRRKWTCGDQRNYERIETLLTRAETEEE